MRTGRGSTFGRAASALFLLAALLAPGMTMPQTVAARDAWLPTSQPATSRGVHVAASLPDGRVLVAGGRRSELARQETLASVEIYDPLADRWLPAAAMNVPREFATATILRDGRVLVVGGIPRFSEPAVATAEIYDFANDRWTLTASMADGRGWHAAVLLPDGRVLVAGGRRGIQGQSELVSAEIYDPALDRGQPAGTLAVARDGLAAVVLPDGRVLAVGGHADILGIYSTAEIYDPATNSWRRVARMAVARWAPTATLLPDGQVLVVGGDKPERFDPVTEQWISADGAIPIAADGHTATLLRDGRVVIAGGYVSLVPGRDESEVATAIYMILAPRSGTHCRH
jgi:hypothetical protein